MRTATTKIPGPARLPAGEMIRLEDQILNRAMALWHQKGRTHMNAFAAWSQAEYEVFEKRPEPNISVFREKR